MYHSIYSILEVIKYLQVHTVNGETHTVYLYICNVSHTFVLHVVIHYRKVANNEPLSTFYVHIVFNQIK